MSLPLDERLVSAQLGLTSEINKLLKRKRVLEQRQEELLEEFRQFALAQFKKNGKPFRVKFRSINGDPGLNYSDLEMEQEFCLEYGNFIFDPKTELMTDYERTEVRDVKIAEDFDEFIEKTTSRPRIFKKAKQKLSNASEVEKTRIQNIMRKRVDKLLLGIFNNEISFEDPKFRELKDANRVLVSTITELENQLKTLEIRRDALEIINRSSGLASEPTETYGARIK